MTHAHNPPSARIPSPMEFHDEDFPVIIDRLEDVAFLSDANLTANRGHRASVHERLDREEVVPHESEAVRVVWAAFVVDQLVFQKSAEATVRSAAT